MCVVFVYYEYESLKSPLLCLHGLRSPDSNNKHLSLMNYLSDHINNILNYPLLKEIILF